MRHRVGVSKLKRDIGSRKALLKGLVTSVIENERVVTTTTKAKAVKPIVDKMITLGKRDTLHARRQAAAFLETPAAVKKLFDKLGTRFGQRNGGYTRIVKLEPRKGDNAPMAVIELVEQLSAAAEAEAATKRAAKEAAAAKKAAAAPAKPAAKVATRYQFRRSRPSTSPARKAARIAKLTKSPNIMSKMTIRAKASKSGVNAMTTTANPAVVGP